MRSNRHRNVMKVESCIVNRQIRIDEFKYGVTVDPIFIGAKQRRGHVTYF